MVTFVNNTFSFPVNTTSPFHYTTLQIDVAIISYNKSSPLNYKSMKLITFITNRDVLLQIDPYITNRAYLKRILQYFVETSQHLRELTMSIIQNSQIYVPFISESSQSFQFSQGTTSYINIIIKRHGGEEGPE